MRGIRNAHLKGVGTTKKSLFMGLAITKYGVKFFRNGVEVTASVKITKDQVAVGLACESPVCIIFPYYVKEIKDHAFQNLDSLEAIYIPEGLKEIGYNAFAGCSKLNTIRVLGDKPATDLLSTNDSIETIEYSQPERKWEISTGRQCDHLAKMLKKGGYVVHLYKSGENFSWD